METTIDPYIRESRVRVLRSVILLTHLVLQRRT